MLVVCIPKPNHDEKRFHTSCAGDRHNMPRPLWPRPLTFWPWKWCPSHVWRGLTSLPILVFLGLSVLDLGQMYATDRQTDRQTSESIIA